MPHEHASCVLAFLTQKSQPLLCAAMWRALGGNRRPGDLACMRITTLIGTDLPIHAAHIASRAVTALIGTDLAAQAHIVEQQIALLLMLTRQWCLVPGSIP